MIPERINPKIAEKILVLKSISKILAANIPVYAPVPGNGIPIKIARAIKIPLFPDFFKIFYPALCPFNKIFLQNFPINLLSSPQWRNFFARK